MINIILLVFLVITAVAIDRQRNLFAAVMLAGIYSLFCASLFVYLDAVDVAFTEAAVGAGISTILFLCTLSATSFQEKKQMSISMPACIIVFILGGLLIYGIQDIPPFGSEYNPVQTYLADKYINDSQREIGIPNLVTGVLASYRGYDTLGEVVVIFTAGVGVLMLLGRRKIQEKNQ